MELGFIKDRLLISASYYRNESSNQLLNYEMSFVSGFGGITRNFPATVQNKGWEFGINSTNISAGKWKWTSSINFTIPSNNLVAFPDLEKSPYANTYIIGQPISIIRTFHMIGVDPATGVYTYANDKGEPTTTPSALTDLTTFVNTTPKYYGAVQNSISWKGLEVDFLVQFVRQIALDYNRGLLPGRKNINQPVSVLDRWQNPGDQAPIQRFSQNLDLFEPFFASGSSDAAYSDASYVRLKNLALHWSLPGQWIKARQLQYVKVYIQAQNLLTITSYKGMDPEIPGKSSIPPLRMITTGVQFGL